MKKETLKFRQIVHILIISSGPILILWSLLKNDVKSVNDLADLKCVVDRFSFKEIKPGSYHHTYLYFIYSRNYGCDFRVPPNCALYFQADLFADNVKQGDTIDVTVSKNMLNEINKLGNVDIFSVKFKNVTFLYSDNSIRERLNANNFFICVGILMIVYAGWWFIPQKNQ